MFFVVPVSLVKPLAQASSRTLEFVVTQRAADAVFWKFCKGSHRRCPGFHPPRENSIEIVCSSLTRHAPIVRSFTCQGCLGRNPPRTMISFSSPRLDTYKRSILRSSAWNPRLLMCVCRFFCIRALSGCLDDAQRTGQVIWRLPFSRYSAATSFK